MSKHWRIRSTAGHSFFWVISWLKSVKTCGPHVVSLQSPRGLTINFPPSDTSTRQAGDNTKQPTHPKESRDLRETPVSN